MNTFRIYEDFRASLGEPAARALAQTLGTMFEELRETVTKEDFRALRESIDTSVSRLDSAIGRLAEAQERTEQRFAAFMESTDERFDRLTAAQERTEQRFAAFMASTDERFDRLTAAQERTEQRLAAFMASTDERFDRLTAAQERTEQRLAAFVASADERFDRLTAAQERTEQRLAAFMASADERFDRLTAAQEQTEQRLAAFMASTDERFDRLTAAQERTDTRLQALAAAQERTEAVLQRLTIRTDTALGWAFEVKFRDRLTSYLGRFLRRGRLLANADLLDEIEPHVGADEAEDFLRADAVAAGVIDGQPSYVVVETSVTADAGDILRAQRRAAVLRKAGLSAVAMVACQSASAEEIASAKAAGVRVWVNGGLHQEVA